ncbi:MAG: hypothetical protein Q8Q35_01480 [Nanoarchaeota archaeon]|nr:hypothetical protein [Nanoarchaeota archaeon]
MKLIKRGTLIIIFLIILSFSVSAATNFSAQDSYDWLSGEISSDGSYNSDVYLTSLAILALDNAGYDTTDSEAWLLSEMDEATYCLPGSACSIKETSATVLAYNELQDDTYFDLWDTWYLDTLDNSDTGGSWNLEVVTSSSGTCTISYELNDELKEVEIAVEEGTFPDCDGSNFLDLDKCVQSNLITTNPGITLDVDCGSLEGNVVLTLVYISDSTYFIVSNENSGTADFQVNNGCFPKSSGGSCDQTSTLWAGWALDKMDSSINTLVYLKESYDDTDASNAAFMYLITSDDTYLADLAALQKSDGSFDRDIFTTGLAALALSDSTDYSEELENAQMFLRDEQGENGDWNEDIAATAMALYGAFGDEDITPTEIIITEEEEDTTKEVTTDGCTTDDDCDTDSICIDDECIESDCDNKGTCDYPDYNENAYNCANDCYCGDDVCDDYETEQDDCPEDCGETTTTTDKETDEDECSIDDDCLSSEECILGSCVEKEGGSGLIIFIIFILILGGLGGGIYFAYKKGYLNSILAKFKKGPQAGTTPARPYTPFSGGQQQRPQMQQARPPMQPQRPIQPQGNPFKR